MSTRALQFDILLLGFRDPDTDAPLAFGVVNFLSAGTSNPLTVWDTKEKTGAKTSVTLDVNGQAQVYGDGVYKLEVLAVDTSAVSYSPMDNIKIRAVSTNVVETNTTYTATTDDDLILCDTSGGAVLINLYPAADFIAGLTIKNISVAGNDVTVDPDGAELIDGQATQALVDGQANEFFSNGTGWFGNGVSTGTNFTSTSLLFGDGFQEDTAAGITTVDVVDVYSTDGTLVLDGGTDGDDATFTGRVLPVASSTVTGAAVSSITISGLGIVAHGGRYRIILTGINNSALTEAPFLFINGDTTTTNYSSAILGAASANNPAIAANYAPTDEFALDIHIMHNTVTDKVGGNSIDTHDFDDMLGNPRGWSHTGTITDITSITITASAAGAIFGIGTKLEVFTA